ncbi:hypothetical protein RJ640_029384 [Escallonia rubra]|uniref:NB-ARC domain-containing protein n=1 Tax=Escallonia rubra TaxID=112253 RepID=A0AA88UJK6_9ASTE|nr:hypothetical protein RJ640_029384 [Escallonia rubra]
MPGVGKTTMMEQVKRAMVEKKEFEENAVAVVSATFEIKSIQRKLANDLGLSDLAKEDDESVRAGNEEHSRRNSTFTVARTRVELRNASTATCMLILSWPASATAAGTEEGPPLRGGSGLRGWAKGMEDGAVGAVLGAGRQGCGAEGLGEGDGGQGDRGAGRQSCVLGLGDRRVWGGNMGDGVGWG